MFPIKTNLNFGFLLFVLGATFLSHAQSDYKGAMVDAVSHDPIPYVNIGIINKGVGTVSDEKGLFHLTLNKSDFSEKDTLQFSSLGYNTIRKAVPDLEMAFNEYPKIAMQPSTILLDEVVVSNKGALKEAEMETVGYANHGKEIFGYWKDNVALGGELATKIKIRKGLRLLKDFSFSVLENSSDSVVIRLNIYKGDTRFPESKLTAKDVIFSVDKPSGMVRINLEPYKIYVENDFTVSLELLKVYGGEIGLVLLGSDIPGVSYTRYASQDKWRKLRSTMAFDLNTSFLETRDKF